MVSDSPVLVFEVIVTQRPLFLLGDSMQSDASSGPSEVTPFESHGMIRPQMFDPKSSGDDLIGASGAQASAGIPGQPIPLGESAGDDETNVGELCHLLSPKSRSPCKHWHQMLLKENGNLGTHFGQCAKCLAVKGPRSCVPKCCKHPSNIFSGLQCVKGIWAIYGLISYRVIK